MLYRLYRSSSEKKIEVTPANRRGLYITRDSQKIEFAGPQGTVNLAGFDKVNRVLEAASGTFLLEAKDREDKDSLFGYIVNQKTVPVLPEINMIYNANKNNKNILGIRNGFIYYLEHNGVKLRKYDYLSGQQTTVGNSPEFFRDSSYTKIYVTSNRLFVMYLGSDNFMRLAVYNLDESHFGETSPITLFKMADNLPFEPHWNVIDRALKITSSEFSFVTRENGFENIREYNVETGEIRLINEGTTFYDHKGRNYVLGRRGKEGDSQDIYLYSLLDPRKILEEVSPGSIRARISIYSNLVNVVQRKQSENGTTISFNVVDEKSSIRQLDEIPFTVDSWESLTHFDSGFFDGYVFNTFDPSTKTSEVFLLSSSGIDSIKRMFADAELVSEQDITENEEDIRRVQIGGLEDILKDMHLFSENWIEDVFKNKNEIYIVTAQRNTNEQIKFRLFKHSSTGVIEIPYINEKTEIVYKDTEKKIHVYKINDLKFICVRFERLMITDVKPLDLKSSSLENFMRDNFPNASVKETIVFDEKVTIRRNRFLVFYTEYYVYPSTDLGPSEDNVIYKARIPHVYDLDYILEDGSPDTIILPSDNSPSGYAREVVFDGFDNIIIAYERHMVLSQIIRFNIISYAKSVLIGDIPRGMFISLSVIRHRIFYGVRRPTEAQVWVNEYFIGEVLLVSHRNLIVKSINISGDVIYIAFEGTNEEGVKFTRFCYCDTTKDELEMILVQQINIVFSKLIFNIGTLEFYGFQESSGNVYSLNLNGVYKVVFTFTDIRVFLKQFSLISGFVFKQGVTGVSIGVSADNIKFPISLEFDSYKGVIVSSHTTINIHFTMLEIFIYYPPSISIEFILNLFPVIKTDDIDWTDRPRKEHYGPQGAKDAKPGDIVYLGSIYYDNKPMPFPKQPMLNGDVNDFSSHNDIAKWDLKNSVTGDEIRWVKVTRNMLIADRPILMNVSYRTLHNHNWIRGKMVAIDNHEFKVRAMTGGVMPKLTPDPYYSGGLPLVNEWDLYIGNRANLNFLPTPTSEDLQSSVGESNFQSPHNSFWNWHKMFTICYEFAKTETPMNEAICLRGFNSSSYWKAEESIGLNEHIAYRPVLLIDPLADDLDDIRESPANISNVRTEGNRFFWEVTVLQYNITNVRTQIVIFDSRNQIVKTGEWVDGTGAKSQSIDLSDLTEGVYTWKIKTISDQFPETWSRSYHLVISSKIKASIKIHLPDGEDYDLVWMIKEQFVINNEIKLFMNDVEIASGLQNKIRHELSYKDFPNGLTKLKMVLFKSGVRQPMEKEISVLMFNGEMNILSNVYISKEKILNEIPKKVAVDAQLSTGTINKVFVSLNDGKDFVQIDHGRLTDVSKLPQGDTLMFVIAYPSGSEILSIDYSWK